MTQRKTVCLDFHSTYEMLDFVQVASDHLGRLAGLDDDALHWVGVAVRESVINAIKHGNRDDERKQRDDYFARTGRTIAFSRCTKQRLRELRSHSSRPKGSS